MEAIMDILARPTNRWRVLNEPRGFIRMLQWLMGIVAFALCANYSATFEFSYECDTATVSQTINITYPFRMAQSNPDFKIPESTAGDCTPVEKELSGDIR